MSEAVPEGVTKQEFSELQTTVRELADALKAQSEAATTAEKKDATEDVRDARADLDKIAKDLGVSPAKLREAADKAKRDEEKERLRPLLVELLDEEMNAEPPHINPDSDPEPDPDPDIADAETADELPPGTDPDPVEDSAPRQEHWSERPIGNLLGRG